MSLFASIFTLNDETIDYIGSIELRSRLLLISLVVRVFQFRCILPPFGYEIHFLFGGWSQIIVGKAEPSPSY